MAAPQMGGVAVLQAPSSLRPAPCARPAACRRLCPPAIVGRARSTADHRPSRRMTTLQAASSLAQAPAGPAAGEEFEGLKGFDDRRADPALGSTGCPPTAADRFDHGTAGTRAVAPPHPPARCRSAAGFACAIMGDLHLEPGHQVGAAHRCTGGSSSPVLRKQATGRLLLLPEHYCVAHSAAPPHARLFACPFRRPQMKLFEEAQRQLVGAITQDPAAVPRVVQLGEGALRVSVCTAACNSAWAAGRSWEGSGWRCSCSRRCTSGSAVHGNGTRSCKLPPATS